MTNTRSMTDGTPWKLILLFTAPMLLQNVVQQIYLLTDTLIVSRTLGRSALAALGVTDWLSYLMMILTQGMAQGFCILLAKDFGANDMHALRHSFSRALTLTLSSCLILMPLFLLLVRPILTWMNTPTRLMSMSTGYLSILYLGLPALLLNAFGAATLRALGNSRTPMHITVFCALLNIALDLVFVVKLKTGVQGAAIATVLSQALAAALNFFMLKKTGLFSCTRADFRKDKKLDQELLRLCLPLMTLNLFICLGGMIVQSQVNRWPLSYLAGYTAANKIYGLLEAAALAFNCTILTYVSQNMGARRYDRVHTGIKDALLLSLCSGALIGLFCILNGHQLCELFLKSSSHTEYALKYGYSFLFYLSLPLPVLYLTYALSSVLQGLGNTKIPLLGGLLESIARALLSFLLPLVLKDKGLMLVEPCAWIFSVSTYLIYLKNHPPQKD